MYIFYMMIWITDLPLSNLALQVLWANS